MITVKRKRFMQVLAVTLALFAAASVMAAGLVVKVGRAGAEFTTADLSAMQTAEGTAYYKNSKGVVTGPIKIKGVKLESLLKLVGGINPEEKLVVTSSDGYVTELDYAKANGDLPATKPDGTTFEGKPVIIPVLITWSDPEMEKDLPRLAFISEGGLITESKYWARNVVEIRLESAAK